MASLGIRSDQRPFVLSSSSLELVLYKALAELYICVMQVYNLGEIIRSDLRSE